MSLEPRKFLAGEEAAWLADKIVCAGEYGNDAARLLRLLSSIQIENQKLQAQVAMLSDAVAFSIQVIDARLSGYSQFDVLQQLRSQLSADSLVWLIQKYQQVRDEALEEAALHFDEDGTPAGYQVAEEIRNLKGAK